MERDGAEMEIYAGEAWDKWAGGEAGIWVEAVWARVVLHFLIN
jgi:hypothetical protein